MEIYKFLGDDSRRKYDALVLSLMLRGKSLLQAVRIADFSIERKALNSPEVKSSLQTLKQIHSSKRG